MSTRNIPTLDLRDYLSGTASAQKGFIDTLGQGLESFGFINVVNHGIDEALLERARAVALRTFGLPDETKRACARPDIRHERGYTPFGKEHAKGRAVADLKEFWHVGRVLPSMHPASLSGDIPQNVFPEDVPAFALTMNSLFDALEGFALHLLDGIGAYLGQPRSFFRNIVENGNSVLRVIHYPDTGEDIPVGAVRAAAHEDINLLTVLPAATKPGLELLTRDGEWLSVETPPGVMVCDTGDMMALLTGGQLPATTHRVVNPPGGRDGGRISMPFFLHPHSECMLSPLRPYHAGPVRARDFLFQRFKEIGVA
jgi:isopenicillin N synthase-like dioxygenase